LQLSNIFYEVETNGVVVSLCGKWGRCSWCDCDYHTRHKRWVTIN